MAKFLSIYNKYLFGLLIFLLVFIPLFPKFPAVSVKGTFVAIRWEDFVIAAVYLSWGIFLLLSGMIKALLKDRLVQLMLIFFFLGGLSLFSAVFLTHTVVPHLGLLHLFRRIEMMMLMPFAWWVVRSKKQLQVCLATLGSTLFAVNIYALGQQYLNWPVISTTNSEFSKGQVLYLTNGARVSSTFAGYYDLAVFLVMALAISAALFFAVKKYLLRGAVAGLSALSFVILVMTAARLSFVAALAGVMASLILVGKRLFVGLAVLVAVLALLYPSQLRDRFVSTITVNLLDKGARYTTTNPGKNALSQLNLPNVVTNAASSSSFLGATTSAGIPRDVVPGEPVNTIQLGVYRSFEIRLNVEWPRALRALEKNALLGTGYSSIDLATDNDYLRSLGEVGILGTIAFVLVVWESSRRVWFRYKNGDKLTRYFSAGVLAMIAAFALNATFIDVFEASKVAMLFWLILGIDLGLKVKDEQVF